MTRPLKTTVDYFPHFVIAKTTLFTIEENFGNDGYALWFKLLEILCQENDFVLDFNVPARKAWFLARCHLTEEKATLILKMLAELDAIDKELWEKHNKIWVQNLIKNLIPILSRREGLVIPQNPLTGDNVSNNPVIGDNNPTKKEKKERTKRTKRTKRINVIPPLNNFFSFKGTLESTDNGNRVGVLVNAFKEWHTNAPQEDIENCGNRFAGMLKTTNDATFILSKIWDTSSREIVGSHLNYIQGCLKQKTKDNKDSKPNYTGGEYGHLIQQ
jgi:hypothetical protein